MRIAEANVVQRISGHQWSVPSQNGSRSYVVDVAVGTCTCPDYKERSVMCKHLWAVAYLCHGMAKADREPVAMAALHLRLVEGD